MSTPRSAELLGRDRQRRLIVVALIVVLVLVTDQVTKTLAIDHLANGPVHLIGPLSLDLAYNAGVAFSIGTGLTLPIIVIGLVVVVLLFWFARGVPSYPGAIGIGGVLGGALGNLGDRLFRSRGGAVVDFIHTGFWPTFNLADASIVGGCALLIVVFWRNGHRVERTAPFMSEPIEIPASLDDERVDRVVALYAGRSRGEVAELVRAGAVRLDGVLVTVRHRRVRAGEMLEIEIGQAVGDAPLEAAPAGTIPFTVVYQDEALLVIDKPAGVVVHPGAGHRGDTLASGLITAFPDLVGAAAAGAGEASRPGIVHRLDKDTSGLLVVARTPEAYRSLVGQLASRTMGRGYRALALGLFDAEQGVIEAPIGRSPRDPTRMAVRTTGRDARTHYAVERRFSDPTPLTLVTLELESGRTHQIRVHLSAIGHPVVGDHRYGGRSRLVAIGRPFLHAEVLRLVHPVSGEPCTWRSPLPDELPAVLASLR